MSALLEQVRLLLREQPEEWPLLAKNQRALDGARVREFTSAPCTLRAQLNPARLGSSTAATDEASVRARACFLCAANRPPEQRSVALGEDYAILCNPFPVLPGHLTVAHARHVPQALSDSPPSGWGTRPRSDHQPWRVDSLVRMLDLVAEIGDEFVVLYNGPRCGASAPDHMHFQAGEKGALPLEVEFERLPRRPLVHTPDLSCHAVEGCFRPFLAIESQSAEAAGKGVGDALRILGELLVTREEPMVNLLATRAGPLFRVLVLPRTRHRPSCYHDPDPARRLLLSPGAIDIAGLFVVVRDADFSRLTEAHLEDVLRETCLDRDAFEALCERLAQDLDRVR